jgi:hypothetical protein
MPTTSGTSIQPAAPSGLTDTAILNGFVNKARDTASQALTGVADAGVTVLIYDGATQLGSAVADSGGAWSYILGRLVDGAHKLTAVAFDAGGHLSAASEALSFKVDTRPPSQPGALADTAISKGLVNAAHNTADQAFTGKTDAGATVTIYDGETQLGTVKAGATGAWSFTLGQLSEGAHKLSATATDTVGNTSARSDALAFTVDTQAPGAPGGLADAKIVGGYVNAAHDVASQALTGMAQAYAFVTVFDGATKLGQVQASETGDWSFTLGKLADGDHSLTATAADKAGNTGAASTALDFTVDTHAPALDLIVVAVDSPAPGHVWLIGDSEAGATLTVSDGATKLASTVAWDDGSWDVTLSGIASGPHSFTISATDAAGNKAAPLSTFYDLGSAMVGGPAVKLDALPKPSETIINLPVALPDGVSYDAATHSFTLDPNAAAYQNLAGGETTTVAVDYGVFDGTKTTPGEVYWTVAGRSTFFANGDITLAGHAVAAADTINDPAPNYLILVGDVHTLTGQAQGGNDNLMLNYGPPKSTVIGDAISISDHARGGNDQVYAVAQSMWESVATAVGDATTLSGYGVGGDDTVGAYGFRQSIGIGDANALTDHARGGDDVVTPTGENRYGTSLGYGDGETMSGYAVGGNDIVTAAVAYGDARSLTDHAQGGDDLLQGNLIYPFFYSTLYGDGAELLGHARGGDDTLVGTTFMIDSMWGDAATIAATATTGADLFIIHPDGGRDSIMDFEPGKDRIELDGFSFTGFADLASHFETTTDGVLITFDSDYYPNSLFLRGVTVAQLTPGDVGFG